MSEIGNPVSEHGLPKGGLSGQVITKASGADGDFGWATPAGGGGGPRTLLAPIDLVFDTRMNGGASYDNGTAGVGATLTATANGALTCDSVAVTVGMRIAVGAVIGPANENPFGGGLGFIPCGIYTVTATGDAGSPWVLTRATDFDTLAKITTPSKAFVTQGSNFAGATVLSDCNPYGPPFNNFTAVGISGVRLLIKAPSAMGPGGSVAAGTNSETVNYGTTTPGSFSAFAQGGGNWFSVAAAGSAIAVGDGPLASNNGELAHASNAINDGSFGGRPGIAQHSWKTACGRTLDATQTPLNDGQEAAIFLTLNETFTPIFDVSFIITGRVVARDINSPFTTSAWSFQGVVKGNGTVNAWVGGAAPTPAIVAQDAAAAAWAVVVDLVVAQTAAVEVKVTGAPGTTIDWECTAEIDQVA